jgi:ParB-like chromosome segregation protein Spo0J
MPTTVTTEPLAKAQMVDMGQPGWRPTQVHPLAERFPMLPPDDFQSLVQDIKENGLQNPIVIDNDGVLIDGRIRLKACERAGVEPRYEGLNGRDPVAYIWGANGKRRQMTKGQLAMIAAVTTNGHSCSKTSGRKLAKLAGVALGTIQKAIVICKYCDDLDDDDLAELVINGTTTLNEAYAEVQQNQRDLEELESALVSPSEEEPDLAHPVTEGELSLYQAKGENRKREVQSMQDVMFLNIFTLTTNAANLEKSSELKQVLDWLGTKEGREQLCRHCKGGIPEFREALEAARRGFEALIAVCGAQ